MIQGLPGVGKTMVITLLVEFFESVLGWSDGVEFACIACMNTMAALIGGSTIHSFGEVPIGDDQANSRKKQKWDKPDVNTMYMKCENMRVLIVDEGSSASCENLATAELNVRTDTRAAAETYKVRHGKRRDAKEVRISGGLNVLFFVDWWQLPPVKQTAISANPFDSHAANVRTIMNMFWTRDVDAMNRCIELTEAKRCQDEWLLAYIQECRDGRQTWNMYNFIHGYATSVVGSWLPLPPGSTENGRTYKLLCGNSDCYELCESTWETERRAGANWPDLAGMSTLLDGRFRICLRMGVGRKGSDLDGDLSQPEPIESQLKS